MEESWQTKYLTGYMYVVHMYTIPRTSKPYLSIAAIDESTVTGVQLREYSYGSKVGKNCATSRKQKGENWDPQVVRSQEK